MFHSLGGRRHLLSHNSGGQKSRYQQGGWLLQRSWEGGTCSRLSPRLGGGQLLPVFHMVFSLSILVLISSSYHSCHSALGPAFHLNHLFKGLVSEIQSHSKLAAAPRKEPGCSSPLLWGPGDFLISAGT